MPRWTAGGRTDGRTPYFHLLKQKWGGREKKKEIPSRGGGGGETSRARQGATQITLSATKTRENAFSRESSRATYVCCTRQGPKNSHIPPPDRYSLFWPRMRSIVSHSHLEVSGETRRCYSRIFLITRRRGSTWPRKRNPLWWK